MLIVTKAISKSKFKPHNIYEMVSMTKTAAAKATI